MEIVFHVRLGTVCPCYVVYVNGPRIRYFFWADITMLSCSVSYMDSVTKYLQFMYKWRPYNTRSWTTNHFWLDSFKMQHTKHVYSSAHANNVSDRPATITPAQKKPLFNTLELNDETKECGSSMQWNSKCQATHSGRSQKQVTSAGAPVTSASATKWAKNRNTFDLHIHKLWIIII